MACGSCQKGQILRVERAPSSSGTTPRTPPVQPVGRATVRTVPIKPSTIDRHRA